MVSDPELLRTFLFHTRVRRSIDVHPEQPGFGLLKVQNPDQNKTGSETPIIKEREIHCKSKKMLELESKGLQVARRTLYQVKCIYQTCSGLEDIANTEYILTA